MTTPAPTPPQQPVLGLTFDCTDPAVQAAFWCVALGYEPAPPPEGWSTWEQWLLDQGVPEAEWADGTTIVDPAGRGPSVTFLVVPEPKTAKNRVHLDIRVSGGRHNDPDLRAGRIRSTVDRLLAHGATDPSEHEGPSGLDHVTLRDPEGNELCVV